MSPTRKRFIWITVPVLAAVALALPKIIALGKTSSSAEVSSQQQSDLPVRAQLVQPQLLENTVRTSGSLIANEEVELRSESTGKVIAIYFKEGSRVKRGDLLVKINDSDLQAELQKLHYQENLAAEKEYRQRQQLQSELISQEQYDTALNALNTIKADIELLEARVAKTEIHAPFDGFIGLKYISEGSYLSPSAKVANLINFDPIKIEFAVPEKYARLLHSGSKITFRIEGSTTPHQGEIYAIEPRIDPVTRTLKARAQSPNPDRQLLPGSFAEVQLTLEQFPDALLIPTEAVIPELNGKKVFVFRGGRAVSTPVETGIRTAQTIQITSGLAAGDTVITSGILQLRTDMAVQITELIKPGENQ